MSHMHLNSVNSYFHVIRRRILKCHIFTKHKTLINELCILCTMVWNDKRLLKCFSFQCYLLSNSWVSWVTSTWILFSVYPFMYLFIFLIYILLNPTEILSKCPLVVVARKSRFVVGTDKALSNWYSKVRYFEWYLGRL